GDDRRRDDEGVERDGAKDAPGRKAGQLRQALARDHGVADEWNGHERGPCYTCGSASKRPPPLRARRSPRSLRRAARTREAMVLGDTPVMRETSAAERSSMRERTRASLRLSSRRSTAWPSHWRSSAVASC